MKFDESARAELEQAVAAGPTTSLAEAIAEYARSIAPVDTGAYRDGIEVETGEGGVVRVLATAGHSLYVEVGTSDTPAFAPMTRAVDAVTTNAAESLEGSLS